MSSRTKISGVYAITNLVSGRRYVGSSVDILDRTREHRALLVSGLHHCRYLQNSWNKHGPTKFVFSILERCDNHSLLLREQFHMDSSPQGMYNTCKIAGNSLGVKRTPETRLLMSVTAKEVGTRESVRKFRSEMAKERYEAGLTCIGDPVSETTKLKMSEAAKRVAADPEERKRRSERAKSQHQAGTLGRKILPIRPRVCKKCQNEFIPIRLPSGFPSQTKWCDACRPPHKGGRYKTAKHW